MRLFKIDAPVQAVMGNKQYTNDGLINGFGSLP